MNGRLLSVGIAQEHDIVFARQRARQIAGLLGFDPTDQTRIATVVSELSRNAFQYAGGGTVQFEIQGTSVPQVLAIAVSDVGPGIPHVDEVLGGAYRSDTGMGLGIAGTRRLVDRFTIETSSRGTHIVARKLLPRRGKVLTQPDIAELARQLAQHRPQGMLEEVQLQNQELLRTLDELRRRQDELERVNGELQDTNRGVVALYAELDERADHLRRADELKTKFLSNMTHEFRTPVNSILALASLLQDRLGSDPSQKDEVYYIRRSAQQLSELVNDLLDIAKVEAGKIDVRPSPFEVDALFGALRGMLRPLLVNQSLALVFEEASGVPPVLSDESKVSQILRNFISNALKYTERGEVRVAARLNDTGDRIIFSVADTGIGIPEADIARVFDEFVQIENPLQRRSKGTGLGLPLSRRLAELLGGSIHVTSTLGVGSTFALELPLVFRDPITARPIRIEPGRVPVLVVDDSEEEMLIYERALMGTRFQVVPTRSSATALAAISAVRPAAIILDVWLQTEDSWELLTRLRHDDATCDIPVVIISASDDRQKGLALGANEYLLKPIDRERLLGTLDRLTVGSPRARILSIDDEETFRFIIGEMLAEGFEVRCAGSGEEGLRTARTWLPDIVLLDLELGDVHGSEVQRRLREDPITSDVPIVILSSQPVSEALHAGADAVLPKAALSRERLLETIRATLAAGHGANATRSRG
ncbi:MAG: ATP-binding protein [Vicinamibacterales bacterium]